MKYIVFIFLILLISCSSPENVKPIFPVKDSLSSHKSNELKQDSVKYIPVKDFDHDKFTHLADSLISLLAHEKITIEHAADTIKNGTEPKYFIGYKNCTLIRHGFFMEKKHHWLNLRVIHAKYTDEKELEEHFTKMKNDALDIHDSTESFTPGLTYTNDYVIKTDKHILWINMSCPYSEKNANRVKQILRQTLSLGPVKDSIVCNCGQSWCNPENKRPELKN